MKNNIIPNKAIWNVFKFTNLIWLLLSSYMWIAFFLPPRTPILVVNAIMIMCIPLLGFKITNNHKVMASGIILILIAIYFASIYHLLSYGVVMLLTYLPALILVLLPRGYKINLLEYITKWYAILLMGSMVIYLITLISQLPPPFGVFIAPNDFYEPFYNYGLYLKYTSRYYDITRFNAFFLEPGHQAIVSFFILMANKLDIKKNIYTITLLVAILLSVSLAGYILLAIGLVCLKFSNIKKLLQVAAMLGVIFIGVQIWNGGDNVINEKIISRLSYDENKGISGNNRFFESTDYLFDVMIRDGYLLTGMREKANEDEIGGAGYKIFILQNGLIAAVLVFAFYYSLIPPNANRQYALSFLFIIFLCFLQRAYPGWYSWLLPFTLGVGINIKKYIPKKRFA